MHQPLYPLSFKPIFQYRPWGGTALARWLNRALPGNGPFGEAWVLSDREDCQSVIADGQLAGRTLAEAIAADRQALMGKLAGRFARFPLLLKFLDVRQMLSVQVHPSDDQADLLPHGELGKDEAWVILDAQPQSRLYAGLKPRANAAALRGLTNENVDMVLPSFAPAAGQGVMIEAGTVHTLGDGLVVFEVQENSDVTFRLFDWDHVDPHTGKARPLQVEQALAAINFAQGAVDPVVPRVEAATPVRREMLFDCAHFRLWRMTGASPFPVGGENEPRVLVCTSGRATIEHRGVGYTLARGDVLLLPAALNLCALRPTGEAQILEIAIPA